VGNKTPIDKVNVWEGTLPTMSEDGITRS